MRHGPEPTFQVRVAVPATHTNNESAVHLTGGKPSHPSLALRPSLVDLLVPCNFSVTFRALHRVPRASVRRHPRPRRALRCHQRLLVLYSRYEPYTKVPAELYQDWTLQYESSWKHAIIQQRISTPMHNVQYRVPFDATTKGQSAKCIVIRALENGNLCILPSPWRSTERSQSGPRQRRRARGAGGSAPLCPQFHL